jgi:hypothetical protein
MAELTKDLLQAVLPRRLRSNITDETMETVAQLLEQDDPIFNEAYQENVLTYTKVLNDGRYKLTDYLSAVKFLSCLMMERTEVDSYIITFPDRYQRLRALHPDVELAELRKNVVSQYVHAYKRTKLVSTLMGQSIIPTYVLNQHHYQEAINTQVHLMKHARREDVRQKAADSLMQRLAPPEDNKLTLNLGISDETRSFQRSMVEQLTQLAQNQQQMFAQGSSIEDIQRLNLVQAEEVVDADLDD